MLQSIPEFSRIRRTGALLGLSFLALGVLNGCGQEATAQGQVAQQRAMPVPVVRVEVRDLPLSWEYPAQVSGFREVEIRARVSGIIEKRGFTEGGKVKQGQSLYSLDSAPYETALAKARADELAAEVRLKQAERDLARIEPLLESKAVSPLEIDTARSAKELAAANLAVARAQVKEARLNLRYSRVESPVTGYASRSLQDEGSLVSGPQALLTTVTQIDRVYVNFGIPEKDHQTMRAEHIDLGAEGHLDVEVLDRAGQAMNLKTKLAFQDVRVNPSTGTIDARAVFQNKKERLSPGQFVRVRVSGAVQKGAVTLPQRAVIQNPAGGKIVMTVSPENTVAPRPVQVAQWEGDQWVITDGLQAGDLVITDGYMKARPGTPVEPMLAEDSATGQDKPAK